MTVSPKPVVVEECDARQKPHLVDSDFLAVTSGDAATFVASYLALFNSVSGLWITLREGYHPSLVARDLATLSHLGRIHSIAIEGAHALDALSVITSLMTGDVVSVPSIFGDLHEAVSRPAPPYQIAFYLGERRESQWWVTPFVAAGPR